MKMEGVCLFSQPRKIFRFWNGFPPPKLHGAPVTMWLQGENTEEGERKAAKTIINVTLVSLIFTCSLVDEASVLRR